MIGEFLGEQELLIYEPADDTAVLILIALPLDDRPHWPVAAGSLAVCSDNYLTARGDKYWERTPQ